MKKIISVILLLISQNIFAQKVSIKVLNEYEDTLSSIAHTMMFNKNEKIREEANNGFTTELLEILQYPNSYNYPFDSLKTISILQPEDKKFKLFNWILRKDDGRIEYYGYIVLPSKDNKKNKIIKLNNVSNNINENHIFKNDNWYGALYYKIICPKKKKNKYYTILGWDGNYEEKTQKIIDVIEINDKEAIFGKDIFIKNENKTFRVLIDYNKNTSVSVNYDNDKKRIVFDNLVPLKESYKEYNAYFVPDGSFNCFQYKNGKWIFYEDVDVRNKNISEKINKKQENGLFNK